MTVLHDETLTESAARITLNPAEEEWSKYSFVLLTYKPAPATTTMPAYVMDMHFGESESGSNFMLSPDGDPKRKNLLHELMRHPFMALFFVGGAAGSPCTAALTLTLYGICSALDRRVYYNDPSQPLNLIPDQAFPDSSFPAGTQIKAIGIL